MDNELLFMRLEEEYRKVFYLDPEELKFLMEDLRGQDADLEELGQVLYDGGLGPEYLGQKYPTDKGEISLILLIACQDNLSVDWELLNHRVEEFEKGFQMYVEKRLPEFLVTGPSGAASIQFECDDADEPQSPESEDEFEGDLPIVINPDGSIKTCDAITGKNKWDASSCLENFPGQIGKEPCLTSRTMHAQWCMAEVMPLPKEFGEAARATILWEKEHGTSAPRGGITPSLWLKMVRESFKGDKVASEVCEITDKIRKDIEPDGTNGPKQSGCDTTDRAADG
jgi:hypothetical protein